MATPESRLPLFGADFFCLGAPMRSFSGVRFVFAALSLPGLACGLCLAQVPAPTTPDNALTPSSPLGMPPHASSAGTNESISLTNGSVNLYIPLLSLPQRGGYSLNLGYVHHSNALSPAQQTVVNGAPYSQGQGQQANFVIQHITYQDTFATVDNPLEINLPRLQIASEFLGDKVTYSSSGSINSNVEVFCETNFAFTDWQGNRHGFANLTNCNARHGATPIAQTPIDITDATDGSFYRLDTTNHADMKVYAKDGTIYHFYGDSDLCPNRVSQDCGSGYGASNETEYDSRAGLIADPNGNTLSIQPGGTGYQVTDTLGRKITVSPTAVSYLDSSGNQQQILVTNSSSPSGSFPEQISCNYAGPPQYLPFVNPVVNSNVPASPVYNTTTTIAFPPSAGGGSRTYTLQFDAGHRVTKIQYPAGGYTRYDYNASLSYAQAFSNIMCSINVGQVFHKYQCAASSGSCGSEQITTYTPQMNGQPSDPFNQSMTIVNPLGEKEIHNFGLISPMTAGSPGVPVETDLSQYSASGGQLHTVHTDYVLSGLPSKIGFPSKVTTTYTDTSPAMSAATQYTYQSYTFLSQIGPQAGIIDNATEIDSYDFNGAVKSKVTQQWEPASAFTASPVILDRLQWRTTTDPATGAVQSTTNGYDTAGNVTSKTVTATGLGSFTTTYTRNSHGQVTKIVDPRSYSTTIGYADNWSGGNSCGIAANSSAYPTSVTNALNQTTTTTYNACTGTVASTQDPNSVVVAHTYDAVARPLCTTVAATGASTCLSYVDSAPESTQQVVAQNTSQSATSVTVLDGFGRTGETRLTSDPSGTVMVDTNYDPVGRVASVSNPYRSTSDPIYGLTSYSYDALARPLTTTAPDGTSRTWVYTGSTTTAYDERHVPTQRVLDGLGRLVTVLEPNSAGVASVATNYTYNAFGDLLTATQTGQSGETPRTRSFTYDGLSRLVTAQNPENGTTCYGTWNGSACQGGYDANGNLLYKTDANGMTLTYTYDALNRLVHKSSPVAPDFVNATLVYDSCQNGIGRLCQESTPAPWINGGFESGTRFSYDPLGRVAGTQWFNYGAQMWQNGVAARYDLAGDLAQITYPDNRVVTQNFDSAGRLASVADITSGTSVPYVNGGGANAIGYGPSGAVATSVLGNGVTQSFTLNNRLQPCHDVANTGALPARSGLGNVFDRSLLYALNSTPCGNASANNGNISNINDNLLPGNTQAFTYDTLNRLTSGSQASNWYNQSYGYDSFGNMIPHDNIYSNPSYSIDSATNRLAMNGSLSSGNLQYNAAGYLTTSPFPGGSLHSNTYTAEGYLRCIDSCNTGSYLTNGLGERTLAVRNNTTSNQYVYLNGQVMADIDGSGVWTDYVYANGQKIAKVDGVDAPLHLSGVNCSNCGGTATYVQLSGGAGRKIQQGDVLSLSQYESGGAAGGAMLLFTDGTSTSGVVAVDQNGQQINCDTVKNQWQVRQISLSAYAGKTLQSTLLIDDVCSSGGQFDLYFNDVAIAGNGSTSTIYSPQRGATFTAVNSSSWPGKATNISAQVQSNPAAPGPAIHFYLADQIGSTQLELAAGGWPTSQALYTPFGQEIVNGGPILPGSGDGTAMRFKFTGKERDTESGLDYFGARYYASNMGRFLSPDWAAQAEPVPYAKLDNPQSLNLYAYVENNPIRSVDPDGHLLHGIDAFSCEGTTGGACSNGTWAGSSSIYTIQSDLVTRTQQQNSNLSPMDKVAMKAEAGALKLTRQALAGGHAAEYGGLILKRNADGSLSATAPIHTGETSVNIDSIAVPRGYTAVGEYHTHPSVDCCESEGPSTQDVNRLRTPELASRIGYVGSAFTGEVRRYTQREPITSMYDTHTYGTVIGTIP